MRLFDLSGKVALVTGGNGGIGLAMAKGLAEAGADIAIGARRQDKAKAALAEIEALGRRAVFIAVDMEVPASVRAMVDAAAAHFGRLDILVNNAGMNTRTQPQSQTDEDWEAILRVNLSGGFHAAKAAYPHMKAAGGGKIINIGSMMSIFGPPFAVAYAASKTGVVGLTRSLASAWAADDIQVNAILPGWFDTDMTRAGRAQVEGLNERVLARSPSGRWGEPEELAGVAVFLASRASSFVTGTALPVDGAWSVHA